MSKLRVKFVSVMYLVFLVFFVLQKIYVEKNLYKIVQYDELKSELLNTQSSYDCLMLKHKIMQEYADGWFDIDWDKAVRIHEGEYADRNEESNGYLGSSANASD